MNAKGEHHLWPHIRAVILGFHVVAVVLAAVPAPEGAMTRSAWKDPTVQGEFDAWHERLASLGYHGDRATFEDDLWSFASAYQGARAIVLRPFAPYYRYAGTSQSWRMFVAPHRFPARLHIDVQRGEVWETVYLERSPDHTWLASILDHDRMRSAIFRYSWSQYGRTYQELCTWLARRAAVDFPDARRIRIRYFKYKTRSPEEVKAGVLEDGKFVFVREIALDPLRVVGVP